jgi:ATP-dependent helicase Lhr and Lhr-like helicase
MAPQVLDSFHPLISRWFRESLGTPTKVQSATWAEVMKGRHLLVTAPTGSGKTLAAFLWAINQLVTGAWSRGGTRVLYISPLRALNNDVRRNLITPLEQLQECFARAGASFPALQVQTRSGDTPGNERRRMLKSPPEILITTPESLNILLASQGNRHLLTGIETVILDEIHAVAGSKRGTHLITALERLVPLSGEFQRIALSATVRPLETVAEFVGGLREINGEYRRRPVAIVRGERTKQFSLQISAPEETASGPEADFWPALARHCCTIIGEHSSTLFFANSRRTTERVTRLINEEAGEELAYAHHGSLSREIRLAVEERLKAGELKAIVATNSLELGIDIGRLDSVVLIQTPRSISSAIQRIGRSGHGVGEVSRGLLFPTQGMDFVAAAVVARAIADGDIEELRPVQAPLDLLAQIILSMALTEAWDLDELYGFLKTSYPYRNLARGQFDLVIGMLEGRYADSHVHELKPRATVDRLANTIATRPALSLLIFLEGGTIPERGYFDLRLRDNGAKIGELDEEFVWERRLGDTFSLGAQVWQITGITHSAVQVVPARRTQQIIPFWRAEELDRDFYYSEKIAGFLENCSAGQPKAVFTRELRERYFMDRGAAEALEVYLRRQREATGSELPHRHHLLVELYHDPDSKTEERQVILHTLWGNSVNRPFTLALCAAWEREYGQPLQAFYNNDGISLLLPREVEVRGLLLLVAPEQIETLLRASLEASAYFGARFRENAGRALLLPKTNFKRRMPLWLNRQRSKKLLAAISRYQDFPVLVETWRSALQDDFDLANLKNLLGEIRDGEIRISQSYTSAPSPFARGLIWSQTNKYVYLDDSSESGKPSELSRDLLKELVFTSRLRPLLPYPLIREFQAKQQRTAPGYAPETVHELFDWVKERQLIPHEEWLQLLAAMERDHAIVPHDLMAQLAGRIVFLGIPGAPAPLVGALEMLPELARGLAREPGEISVTPLLEDEWSHQALQRSLQKIKGRQADAPDVPGAPDAPGAPGVPAVLEVPKVPEVPKVLKVLKAPAVDQEDPSSVRFLGSFLCYYGPVQLSWLQRTLALPEAGLLEALQELEESGLVLLDQFTEESSAPEVCDAANLEALLRMLRRSRRPAFEALELSALPLFLASFQGLTRPGSSLDDLRARLDQLLGLPLPAGVWEEELLPARLEPYFSSWLDTLMQTSDLLWFGCGRRRLAFAFPEELDLFQGGKPRGAESDAELLGRLLPDPNGRYSLPAISLGSRLPAATATAELWKLAWKGELSNDSFASIRKGILNKFVRREASQAGGLRHTLARRWHREQEGAGNWFLLPRDKPLPDPLAREELNKDRVRVLLDRYGILFRELLLRELPALQWHGLFRTLRIMELSGELLPGNFFHGIPGLQFMSQEGYRSLTKGLPGDTVYWVNATDPASLCGSGLAEFPDRLPARLPSTHLVYRGVRLVLVSRRYGKDLELRIAPEDPQLPQYLAFFKVLLTREFNPLKRVFVERINGEPAATSPYAAALKAFGFQVSYKGLELWRSY